MAIVTFC